jgi:hypothetical protein
VRERERERERRRERERERVRERERERERDTRRPCGPHQTVVSQHLHVQGVGFRV